VSPTTLQRLQAKLPNAMVSNSWGMTEAGPAFCFMPPEEQTKRIGSVGKPSIGNDGQVLAKKRGEPEVGGQAGERGAGNVLSP
jgi:acyl-coenzyme A synthetase/AMP-(fatty) acid ligase